MSLTDEKIREKSKEFTRKIRELDSELLIIYTDILIHEMDSREYISKVLHEQKLDKQPLRRLP